MELCLVMDWAVLCVGIPFPRRGLQVEPLIFIYFHPASRTNFADGFSCFVVIVVLISSPFYPSQLFVKVLSHCFWLSD